MSLLIAPDDSLVLRRAFLTDFSVADFHHQDDQTIIVDLVDDPIVAAPDLVEGGVALHLGGLRHVSRAPEQ